MGKNQYEINLHFVISSFQAMGKNQYETNLHFVISSFLPMTKELMWNIFKFRNFHKKSVFLDLLYNRNKFTRKYLTYARKHIEFNALNYSNKPL